MKNVLNFNQDTEPSPVYLHIKNDLYHRAASWLTESQLSKGRVFLMSNGRILLQVYGQLNGKSGVFEYIINWAGQVCHQLFKEGKFINGKPN